MTFPGIVETVAGGGEPHKGKKNYCNDKENSRDGYFDEARFNYPWGIAYNPYDNAVYVADCGCMDSEHRTDKIRKIDLKTREVTTIAGSTQGFRNGYGRDAHFKHIAGLSIDPELNMLYVADSGNQRIRVIYLANSRVETVAGLPHPGHVDQTLIASQFNNPQSVVVHRKPSGERVLYVADTDNHVIRVIRLNNDLSGDVKTVAGQSGVKGFKDGRSTDAQFYHPTEVAVDGIGKFLFIADMHNDAIRRLDLTIGMVTTLTSKGFQILTDALQPLTITSPEGLEYDPDYDLLYICEFEKNDILVASMDGSVKVVAGNGSRGNSDGVGRLGLFYYPSGITFDRKTRKLYVADQYNHLVRSVTGIGSKEEYDSTIAMKWKRRKSRRIQASTSSNIWLYFAAIGSAVLFFIILVIKPLIKYICIKFMGVQSSNTTVHYHIVRDRFR